jgi:hypothetical protein
MGCPTFDRSKAADYLIRQLKNGGFKVERLSLIDIHVDWNIKARKKNTTSEMETKEEAEVYLPSLINLKKLAAKHKRTA